MKNKTLNNLRKTIPRLSKTINSFEYDETIKYGSTVYEYSLGLSKALDLWYDEDYHTVNTILELVNTGIDILKIPIIKKGSQRIDSQTKNQVSLKPLTREILRSKYQVSDSFKDITLNSINDELPVRLSQDALSKLVKKVFPDVQERKCTNDIKYNLDRLSKKYTLN